MIKRYKFTDEKYIFHCACERCGYVWTTKNTDKKYVPKRCADTNYCGSPYWNKKRIKTLSTS